MKNRLVACGVLLMCLIVLVLVSLTGSGSRETQICDSPQIIIRTADGFDVIQEGSC
jgi:hypothetical protein